MPAALFSRRRRARSIQYSKKIGMQIDGVKDMTDKQFESELLQLIYDENRLDTLAGKIERLTGYPVYFTTVNWEVIACSSGILPDDIIKKEVLFSSKKDHLRSWSDYARRKSQVAKLISRSPYLTSIDGKKYLFANARLDSCPVGTVVLPEHTQPVSDFDPIKLDIILRVFAVFFTTALGEHDHLQMSNWESILRRLLDGSVSDRLNLNQLIKENGVMTEPDSFRIFVFRVRGANLALLPACRHLKEAFGKLQVFRCWIEYDDSIVLLVNDSTPVQEVPSLVRELLPPSFLEENSLHAGYSDLSSDLLQIPLLYQEARSAIDYTNRWNTDSNLSSYEACRPYDLLCNTTSPTGSLSYYVSNRIEAMAQYDAEHGTQYVTIVRELINNRFSLTAASAALYMHKSTLSYHMNRIRDHFHINFEDKLQILHLYQSFFIMDDFLHE